MLVSAGAVEKSMAQSLRRARYADGDGRGLQFYITNTMHDETKLYVKGFGRGRSPWAPLAIVGLLEVFDPRRGAKMHVWEAGRLGPVIS